MKKIRHHNRKVLRLTVPEYETKKYMYPFMFVKGRYVYLDGDV